jgi:hypothetical protein
VLGHRAGVAAARCAGTPIGVFGNPPEAWLVALPLYAQLQSGEAAHRHDHLAHGVPDLRVATLPARYEDLLLHDLPLERDEIRRVRDFARLANPGLTYGPASVRRTTCRSHTRTADA